MEKPKPELPYTGEPTEELSLTAIRMMIDGRYDPTNGHQVVFSIAEYQEHLTVQETMDMLGGYYEGDVEALDGEPS